MKAWTGKHLRNAWKPLVGFSAFGILAVGCGDKASNPDAATVEDLKFPAGLSIQDNGGGSVTLMWRGANNEDDFDGYNVYGAKATADILAQKNKVIELVDGDGNAVPAAKTYLEKFNYNGKDLETKGDKKDADAEFEFLPINTPNAAAEPQLPTCRISGDNCVATTDANKTTKGKLNGLTKFEYKGLKPGSEYCFLVLSSMGEGETVSQTSSEVRCVKPKLKTTITLKVDGTSADSRVGVNMDKLCDKAAGTCTAPATADGTIVVQGTEANSACTASTAKIQACADTPEDLNLEDFSSDGSAIYFTGGKNAAIKIVGYKSGGLVDATLPQDLPALTEWSANLENEGGYSLSGASLPVFPGYVYLVAVGAGDATPTAFTYYWVYVESTSVARGADVKLQVLYPAAEGDLTLGDEK